MRTDLCPGPSPDKQERFVLSCNKKKKKKREKITEQMWVYLLEGGRLSAKECPSLQIWRVAAPSFRSFVQRKHQTLLTAHSLFLYSKREDVTTGSPHPEKRLFFFVLLFPYCWSRTHKVKLKQLCDPPTLVIYLKCMSKKCTRICVYLFKFLLRRFSFCFLLKSLGGENMQCQIKEQLLRSYSSTTSVTQRQ